MITNQKGIYTVEFAIVGSVFLVTLLSIIELGLTFMTWNALSEAARRGARVAVVCPVDDAAIKNIAIFDNPAGEGGSIIPGLSTTHIDLAYLDSDGVKILNTVTNYIDIRYVRVSINESYTYPTVLPWLSAIASAPPFETTLPRESLGVSRESVDACSV